MLRDAAVPHAALQQLQASWPENLAMQVCRQAVCTLRNLLCVLDSASPPQSAEYSYSAAQAQAKLCTVCRVHHGELPRQEPLL